jgi:hypothetical protein
MQEKIKNHGKKMSSPGQSPGDAPDSESRRKFGKAGLAVGSAVILTVASRPVLANTMCKTPSGFVSGNVSQHGAPPPSQGLTPGYWKNHYGTNAWPSYKCGTLKGTTCNSWDSWNNDGTKVANTYTGGVFSCKGSCKSYAGYTVTSYNKTTKRYTTKVEPYSLMQVLWMGGSMDKYEFGAHMCAALLNAQDNRTNCLSVQAVKNMWNECDQKGYYEPTAGVKWYPQDCVTYLKSTMS